MRLEAPLFLKQQKEDIGNEHDRPCQIRDGGCDEGEG